MPWVDVSTYNPDGSGGYDLVNEVWQCPVGKWTMYIDATSGSYFLRFGGIIHEHLLDADNLADAKTESEGLVADELDAGLLDLPTGS